MTEQNTKRKWFRETCVNIYAKRLPPSIMLRFYAKQSPEQSAGFHHFLIAFQGRPEPSVQHISMAAECCAVPAALLAAVRVARAAERDQRR